MLNKGDKEMLLKDIKIVNSQGNVEKILFRDSETNSIQLYTADEIANMLQEKMLNGGMLSFPYASLSVTGDIKYDLKSIQQSNILNNIALKSVIQAQQQYETTVRSAYLETGYPCISCVTMLKDKETKEAYVWIKILIKSNGVKRVKKLCSLLTNELQYIDGIRSVKDMQPFEIVVKNKYIYCERMLVSQKALEYITTAEYRKKYGGYYLFGVGHIAKFKYLITNNITERISEKEQTQFIEKMRKYTRTVYTSIKKQKAKNIK
jgi:hypothetical protein